MKIEMSLIENSKDYIINALELYEIADEDGTHRTEKATTINKNKWKLSFIALVQGFELLLKYGLSIISPIMIFNDIDALQISTEKTVSLSLALNRLKNFEKSAFNDKEIEFIKACTRLRNNFVHCTVEISTEEIKNKFAKLYSLYYQGYKFYSGINLLFADRKLNNSSENLMYYANNMTIFRGEEIHKKDLPLIKEEIDKYAKQSYFSTSNGLKVQRIAFGEEVKLLQESGILFTTLYSYEFCDDCGVKQREYHLPGCDLEICPVCGKQKVTCECDLILNPLSK